MKFKGEENAVLWESYMGGKSNQGGAGGSNTRYYTVAKNVIQQLYSKTPEQFVGYMKEIIELGHDPEREVGGKRIIDTLTRQFSKNSGVYDLISNELKSNGMAEEDADYNKRFDADGSFTNYKRVEDEEDDFMSDDLEDDFSDDGIDDFDDDMDFGDDLDDDLGGGQAQGMVMEIEPVGHVEKHEINEVLVSELKKLAEYADRLYEKRNDCEFEDWMVSAITIASTYVSDVWHRLDAKADFANTGFEQADDYEKF